MKKIIIQEEKVLMLLDLKKLVNKADKKRNIVILIIKLSLTILSLIT